MALNDLTRLFLSCVLNRCENTTSAEHLHTPSQLTSFSIFQALQSFLTSRNTSTSRKRLSSNLSSVNSDIEAISGRPPPPPQLSITKAPIPSSNPSTSNNRKHCFQHLPLSIPNSWSSPPVPRSPFPSPNHHPSSQTQTPDSAQSQVNHH